MRVVVFAAAAAMLAGCQTPCPSPTTDQAEGPTRATFACDDGSRLIVTFTRRPDVADIVQDGYPSIQLPQQVTGSGYRYAAEGAELRGRGEEVRWTRPGSEETLCQEIH